MSSSFSFPVTARSLAEYFARQESINGSRWTPARVAAEEWLRLLEADCATPEEVVHLDELMLEGLGEEGSAWYEFRRAYERWREEGHHG